jgi:hypothetical protein
MSVPRFDLGLCEADETALRDTSRTGFPFDRAAALRLIARASLLVDAAVRRRPLFAGAAFELPGHEERPEVLGSRAKGSTRTVGE